MRHERFADLRALQVYILLLLLLLLLLLIYDCDVIRRAYSIKHAARIGALQSTW